MRLIDADALMGKICARLSIKGSEYLLPSERDVYKVIDEAPTIDAVPVRHGRWHSRHYYRKASNSYDCEVFVCGECQAEFSYDAETGVQASDWHYCPNCGATMDSEQTVQAR